MNNKGISSIELLVSFVIISFVAISMFKAVFDMLDKIDFYQEQTQITVLKGNIINSLQKDFNQRKLYGYTTCGTNCYDFTYQDLTTRRFKVDTTKKTIQYGGIAEGLPKGFDFTGSIIFNTATISSPTDRNDTILRIFIPMSDAATGINGDINIVHQFDSRNMKNLPNQINANAPVLASGMVPIKWNGTSWVDTTESDMTWYSYDVSNKMWANARTADGSMWVWIPRYIYKISSGWHSNTAGTIEVQFSKGTNDNWNSSVIGDINTDTTSNASNGTWTNHPAFRFDNTELTGFWIAKFEASVSNTSSTCYTSPSSANCNVTSLSPKFVPNVSSWRYINVSNMFTTSRNMETNSSYGWGSTGNNIDSHLTKNVEWGAVAYLSKSTYGKTDEVWINPANNYTTGCAGDSVSSVSTVGCLRTYDTAKGMNASTSGNIYGVYDMSGGAFEYTAAYVNNGNANLTTYGSSVLAADLKYKDVYTNSASGTRADNYALAISKKGDAVYETSSSDLGAKAWYEDWEYMPSVDYVWYNRGGNYGYTVNAGLFSADAGSTGYPGFDHAAVSFRPVLLVGAGL